MLLRIGAIRDTLSLFLYVFCTCVLFSFSLFLFVLTRNVQLRELSHSYRDEIWHILLAYEQRHDCGGGKRVALDYVLLQHVRVLFCVGCSGEESSVLFISPLWHEDRLNRAEKKNKKISIVPNARFIGIVIYFAFTYFLGFLQVSYLFYHHRLLNLAEISIILYLNTYFIHKL